MAFWDVRERGYCKMFVLLLKSNLVGNITSAFTKFELAAVWAPGS